jgi:dihydrofolate reductase
MRWTVDAISRAGVHAMGSRTFQDMAAYWPTSTEPFAAPMNSIPKVVFARHGRGTGTRSIDDARAAAASPQTTATPEALAGWRNARVASGELADEIAELKRESGGPIVAHGGASFAQSLVELGAIDEYQLLVHPIALGHGLPLFPVRTQLDLIDLQRFDSGTVAHVLRPRRA